MRPSQTVPPQANVMMVRPHFAFVRCLLVVCLALAPPMLLAQVPFHDVVQTSSAGGWDESSGHSCALLRSGHVRCWGANRYGQLGDGTTIDRTAGVEPVGLNGVVEISVGNQHSCALLDTGNVLCWGRNDLGRLGDGTEIQRSVPTLVSGIQGTAVAITAGDYHSCALHSDGSASCWGSNLLGELGNDGSGNFSLTPVPVLAPETRFVSIKGGGSSTCGITSTREVRCWGNNNAGQLGDGTFVAKPTPVPVIGLSVETDALSLGYAHACALGQDTVVRCWGQNTFFQLGYGNGLSEPIPHEVIALPSGIRGIGLGADHSCALSSTGSVLCWGRNENGQLGNGETATDNAPAEALGLPAPATSISAADLHTCATLMDGSVRCWGDNYDTQLGNHRPTRQWTPQALPIPGADSVQLSAGTYHTCVTTSAADAYCWGLNDAGQLGHPLQTAPLPPQAVPGLSGNVLQIAAGSRFTCALTLDRTVKCWGSNYSGQLGDGSTTTRYEPVDVSGLGNGISAVATGGTHTCAILPTGGIKCWGSNSQGQVGNATASSQTTFPVDVSGINGDTLSVSLGANHSCVLLNGGSVKCWGANSVGQLGDGTMTQRRTPVDVIGLPADVVDIDLGGKHSCALTSTGHLYCWGYNYFGQLGLGDALPRALPTLVADVGNGAAALSVGMNSTCVVMQDHSVKCWGNNRRGQLGDASNISRSTPSNATGITNPIAIAGGGSHTCAIGSDREVSCWGDNYSGQLGDGTPHLYTEAVETLDLEGVFRDGFE